MKRGWRPCGRRGAREPLPAAAAVLCLLSLPWGPRYSCGCFRSLLPPFHPPCLRQMVLEQHQLASAGLPGACKEKVAQVSCVLKTETSHPGLRGATSSWDVSVGPGACVCPDGTRRWQREACQWSRSSRRVRACAHSVRPCGLRGCSLPGSSVHGVLRARTLGWVAVPSSRGSSRPRVTPASLVSPAMAGGLFSTRATGEAQQKSGKQVTGWVGPDTSQELAVTPGLCLGQAAERAGAVLWRRPGLSPLLCPCLLTVGQGSAC